MADPDGRDASGAQRFQHGIDSVDDHSPLPTAQCCELHSALTCADDTANP
jgi:hypothetical protein